MIVSTPKKGPTGAGTVLCSEANSFSMLATSDGSRAMLQRIGPQTLTARSRSFPKAGAAGARSSAAAAMATSRFMYLLYAQVGEKDFSGTPLGKKLGAKPGTSVVVFFTASRDDLARRFASLRDTLDPADGLWIAYPKKASKLDSDLSFESVQQVGLDNGLVDNKSCAIDENWTAVRFVYRLEDRPS